MAINTVGTGGNYSSPQAWEASLPATLTEQEVARVIDDLTGLTNVQKTFDINVVTSASNDIIIEGWDNTAGELREQDYKAGNGNVPVIVYGRGGTFGLVTLRNGANHVTVRNLTSELTNTSTHLVRDIKTVYDADNYFRHEHLYSYTSGIGGGGVFITSDTKGYAKNCLFLTNNESCYSTGNNFDVEECTIVANLDGTANNDVAVRNNDSLTRRVAAFNFGPTSGFACYLDKAAIFEDNASSDTSGNVGFQNLAVLDQYTDPANHDWSFKAGNSLEGAATGGLNIGITAPTGGGGGFEPQWAVNSNVILG